MQEVVLKEPDTLTHLKSLKQYKRELKDVIEGHQTVSEEEVWHPTVACLKLLDLLLKLNPKQLADKVRTEKKMHRSKSGKSKIRLKTSKFCVKILDTKLKVDLISQPCVKF